LDRNQCNLIPNCYELCGGCALQYRGTVHVEGVERESC
jgi:hypothetical protein